MAISMGQTAFPTRRALPRRKRAALEKVLPDSPPSGLKGPGRLGDIGCPVAMLINCDHPLRHPPWKCAGSHWSATINCSRHPVRTAGLGTTKSLFCGDCIGGRLRSIAIARNMASCCPKSFSVSFHVVPWKGSILWYRLNLLSVLPSAKLRVWVGISRRSLGGGDAC